MSAALPAGTQLRNGQYTVEKVLGQGGFGITYVALDSGLGVEVALKELFPGENAQRGPENTVVMPSSARLEFDSLRQEFRTEAQTLLGLRHPAVVRVLSVFEEHGTAYLVMELLVGETLEAHIVKVGQVLEPEAKKMLEPLLGALEEIHRKGLLHRDIKPDNLMLTADGPVLIDFGTAQKMGGGGLSTAPTLTPAYAPLEQYLKNGNFGPPTDLYALAATFYYALGGVQPPSSLERARGAILQPLSVFNPAVSPRLERALERAMQLKIAERPQSAAELRSLIFSAEPNSVPISPMPSSPISSSAPVPLTPPSNPVPSSPERSVPTNPTPSSGIPTYANPSSATSATHSASQPRRPVLNVNQSGSRPSGTASNGTAGRRSSLLPILIGLVVLGGAGYVGWTFLKGNPTKSASSSASSPSKPTPTPSQPSSPPPTSLVLEPESSLLAARAEVLSAYRSGNYAEAVAKADERLNSVPTDALVALYRSNALQKQLGHPTLSIGVSVPTSGKNAQSGEAVLQGVGLAVLEANLLTSQGGTTAKKYVLVEVLNDAFDRAQAVQVATRFVANPDILGVIGPVNSSAAVAAAEIYAQGLPHLLPTAVDDRLSKFDQYTFRLSPNNAVQARALVKIARARNFRSVALYQDDKDAYSKSLGDNFRRLAQGLSVTVYPFVAGTIPSSLNKGEDAALIAGSYPDVAGIAQALSARGNPPKLLSGSAAYSQELLKQGGSAIEGLTLTVQFHSSLKESAVQDFVRRFTRAYGGGLPNARAAQAYLATRTLLRAMDGAAGPLTRDAVDKGLKRFATDPIPGLLAPIRFDSSGGVVGQPFVEVHVEGGKLVARGIVR